jgi:alkylation response protein AidB-like acyl-CoA dehydrogenase
MTEGIQAAVWITNACLRVAEMCFALGGGSAVYEDSMLQRRLRDLHVAAQHAMVQQRHYIDAGKLLISKGFRRLTPLAAGKSRVV